MREKARREYRLCGTVVRGNGYGRKLGFPTANLELVERSSRRHLPPSGVYAGTAEVKSAKTRHIAGIVIGPNQKNGLPKIEAHLLDFTGNLYDERMIFSPMHRIRAFKNFASESVLKKQITKDVLRVRHLISLEHVPKPGFPSRERRVRR